MRGHGVYEAVNYMHGHGVYEAVNCIVMECMRLLWRVRMRLLTIWLATASNHHSLKKAFN